MIRSEYKSKMNNDIDVELSTENSAYYIYNELEKARYNVAVWF